MTAVQTPKKLKHYEFVIKRTQIYTVGVDAYSPETASKALWWKVRFDEEKAAPLGAKLVSSVWDDPSDHGEEWPISGPDLPPDPTGHTSHVWDGMKIICKKLPQQVIAYLRGRGFSI